MLGPAPPPAPRCGGRRAGAAAPAASTRCRARAAAQRASAGASRPPRPGPSPGNGGGERGPCGSGESARRNGRPQPDPAALPASSVLRREQQAQPGLAATSSVESTFAKAPFLRRVLVLRRVNVFCRRCWPSRRQTRRRVARVYA